jgi:hypothetical protein
MEIRTKDRNAGLGAGKGLEIDEHCSIRTLDATIKGSENARHKITSQHLELSAGHQVLDRLALGRFRRFAIWYLLARQDYFELIPSRSNNFQPVRGLLGCS